MSCFKNGEQEDETAPVWGLIKMGEGIKKEKGVEE
jgi:hypothetical protein